MIYLPKNIPTSIQYGYAQHEYGHYLQEQSLPSDVYNQMAHDSFMDAMFGSDHSLFWVETNANTRAAAFFPATPNRVDIHNDILWPKFPNH